MYLYIDRIEQMSVKMLLANLISLEEGKWEKQLRKDLQKMSISLEISNQIQVKLNWIDHKNGCASTFERVNLEGEELLQFYGGDVRQLHEERLASIALLMMLQYLEISSIYLSPHSLNKEEINQLNVSGLQISLKLDQKNNPKGRLSSGNQKRKDECQSLQDIFSLIRYLHTKGKIMYINSSEQLEMNIKKHLSIPLSDNHQGNIIWFSGLAYGSPTSHQIEHIDPEMVILQSNIDDMNPEIFPYIMQHLFEKGANDVFLQPIVMKKGRMGTMLQVLCHNSLVKEMKSLIFRETTTLGIRQIPVAVHRLGRESKELDTEWGTIGYKIGQMSGEIVQVSPEYEQCKAIAEKHKIPIQLVYDRVRMELNKGGYHAAKREE